LPELPDVEYLRKITDKALKNKKIESVTTHKSRVYKSSPQAVRKHLQDATTEQTKRRGKHLLLELNNDYHLILHFGMTGYVNFIEKEPPKHSHLIFHLKNSKDFAYVCIRKLGKIEITKDPQKYFKKNNIGKDAMDIELEKFLELLGKKRGSVKSAFMDQSLFSGMGNIYTDELLFQTGIYPKKNIRKIDKKTLEKNFHKMKEILSIAIDSDAKPKKMPSDFLLHRRKEGAKCHLCKKGKIQKIKVNGRSTYFCNHHQK